MNQAQENENKHSLARFLASWVSNTDYSKLPTSVINICKKAMLDVSVVGVAGQNSRVAQSAISLADRFYDERHQHQALLFNGDTRSAATAAYCNAVSAHAYDMDDTCYAGIVHASVLIGPTVLAIGQANQSSGKQVLTAFTIGSEITYALGQAVGSSLYENDWWPTGLLGVIGTTAAIAKLENCDELTIARAISFALLNASPFRCMQGTDSKPLMIGETVKRAIDAVEVAKTHLSIPLDVFEKPEGPFMLTVGNYFDRNKVMQLGEHWRLIDPGLVIKLFPLCSCAQTSVEGLIEIMQDNDLENEQIESVSILTTSMVKKTLRFDSPEDENQAMFSLTYPLACVLVDKTVRAEHISHRSIFRDVIKSAKSKISYEIDDGLFNLELSPEAAIVTVKTHSGDKFDCKKLYPTGDPRSPATKAQVRSKIESCLDSKINVDKFILAFDNIDNTKNINELTNHFKGQS